MESNLARGLHSLAKIVMAVTVAVITAVISIIVPVVVAVILGRRTADSPGKHCERQRCQSEIAYHKSSCGAFGPAPFCPAAYISLEPSVGKKVSKEELTTE